MSGWNNWSFRRKLFSILLLTLTLNLVVLLVMGSTLFEGFYQKSKVGELEQSARRIRAAYEENSGDIYDAISQIENENVTVSLFKLDEAGEPAVEYHSRAGKEGMRPWGDRPDMPQPKRDDLDRFRAAVKQRLLETGDGYNIQGEGGPDRPDESLTLSTRLDDNLYLYLQTPREYIKSTADLAVKYTALLSMGILLAGSVIVYFVAGRISRPIREIQAVAEQISKLDFSRKCPVNGGDEIGRLGAAINNMSDDLQAAVSKLVQANEVLQSDLERQQQTDRMRQQFVANVSHDFKTPLTLMVSYAEALCEQERDEGRREYCETIISEGNRLSRMVGRLLCLSKLESGIDQVEYAIFCLSEVLDQVLKNHRILTERRRLTVERRLDEELIVRADYQKIELVVQNLFENAVKYTPEGGTVRLTAARRGDACRVEVENTGVSIREEDLGSLFDSFYRADKARTSNDGYGLGLAVVKVVMDAHGRPFGVENTPDGVRFWFELELADLGDDEEPTEGE